MRAMTAEALCLETQTIRALSCQVRSPELLIHLAPTIMPMHKVDHANAVVGTWHANSITAALQQREGAR